METQARVMATLNKVKEARAKKQEKLGAIEDAIKEVQENLIAKEKEMTSIVTELGTQIENIKNKSRLLAEDLSTSLREASIFDELELEYIAIANELDNLGIPYNTSLQQLQNDYSNGYDIADELINSLGL